MNGLNGEGIQDFTLTCRRSTSMATSAAMMNKLVESKEEDGGDTWI